MKNKDIIKWIIIGLIVIAVIIALYFIFRPAPVVQPQNGNNPNSNPNFANSLAGILSGLFSSGWINNLFGKKPNSTYCDQHPEDITQCNSQTDCYNGCKSSMPGYDCNGQPSAYC